MALHERETVRDQLEDCVFADRDLTRPVAKYRFPPDGTLPRDAFQLVADELMLDGNARQNLATFCQTWEEPEVLGLMALSINKNMIDRDEYPQSAEIERRCVHMMADLWNAPEAANTVGTSAIGSSEACMLAGMAAKWRWRAKRRAAGKPTDNPNMVCGPVQVVWHKFARYWDIEMREVPMSPGRYMMDAGFDAGTGGREHDHGRADARRHLHRRVRAGGGDGRRRWTSCRPTPAWTSTFTWTGPAAVSSPRSARPRSSSTSACPGSSRSARRGTSSGWLRWVSAGSSSGTAAELPDDLIFHVNYLGGDMPVFQINFSRPAGQIIASYYNFLRLGHEGYRNIHQASYDIGQYLAAEIVKLGPFELLCDSNPNTGIPTVTWRIREGENPGYTLFDLADRLRGRGWQVPAYTLTGTASDIAVQRILVRLGVSQDMAALLLDDFRDAVAHFDKHPVTVSMTKEESGGFSHL